MPRYVAPDINGFPTCHVCDRRTRKYGQMCAACRAAADAAEKRAVRIEDPDSEEAPEERPFNTRLAEGFAMLNGEHCS